MELDNIAFKKLVMDKPFVQSEINALVDEAISVFETYERIQLLGGLGLILIDNLPTIDKLFEAQMSGTEPELDENAEIVMEYAMNFGTAIESKSEKAPTKEVIEHLYGLLKGLSHLYNVYDMPVTDTDYDAWLTWIVHLNHIYVRGDGYPCHVEQVFDELFRPHDEFFKSHYGFGFDTLKSFCLEIERYILSKIGTVGGAHLAWQRWIEDSEKKYGTGEDAIEKMLADKPGNGVMGSMIDRNPDLFGDSPMHILSYQPDDFGNSEKIFWVVPQNEEQKALYEKVSRRFGENASFIAEGEYKGNIMSGMDLYKKPLVKKDDKYFCFTPMIPHRNMIGIAESLLKEDSRYYDQHYRNNTDPNSRDKYMEKKVVETMTKLLPRACVYHSAKYNTNDEDRSVTTELDVICISEKANYVIEIKGHELSNTDKVKINGFKDKFKDSVGYGCHQACRAENHINNEDSLFIVNGAQRIVIDKTLPTIKIVVTLQHYSAVLGHFKYLVGCGLMEKEYWDVWVVSLYDFLVVSDNIKEEQQLIDYIEAHNCLQKEEIEFNDELDVFSRFLTGSIEEVMKIHPIMLIGGSEMFDKMYSGCFL